MTFKVDSAGRIRLPKALRDRLGMDPGKELEAVETAEGILLRVHVPVVPRQPVVKWRGWKVTGSFTPPGAKRDEAAEREEELRRAWEDVPKDSKLQ